MHNFAGEKNQLTVIFDVSFTEKQQVIEEYIIKEECPFIYDLNRGNLTSFQWYFSEGEKTATLVEVSKSSDAWEKLASQVIGSPVNVKFNEFFTIEKLTILGNVSDSFKEKVGPMNPVSKVHTAGFSEP
tara:strand:+ start:717 stop:1103 length:387 start_codon:yes stop_codon:yes gene_type:complete